MQLTGFTDEAGQSLATQIQVTQELGWSHLSARSIDGQNIHDLTEPDFQRAAAQLQEGGIQVVEFGSLIGTWGKSIDTDFAITLAEVERCIPRMHALGTQLVRVMSYAQQPWGQDQAEQERFSRLRAITERFTDAGITVAHENCMNWGGFSAEHTLRLLDEVPGLQLIFDTGNPVFQLDRSKQQADGAYPWQDALEFYHQVREHIVHVHIKDCLNPPAEGQEPRYTFPGKGQGAVREVLADLHATGYDGYLAIEPHVATVFHLAEGESPDWQQCYDSYLQYGRALEGLLP